MIMARYTPSKNPDPIAIKAWLGTNEAVGLTGLKLGEALRQVNYRITKDFHPKKREGHKTFINYANAKNIQGMWEGTIASKNVLISCNDGKVYEYNFATEINTQIGTMTDAKTSIFYFESKLYFMNGTDYKQYDGTTFQDVVPYVPTIAEATPPSGGGTDAEPINLLIGEKKQEFIANGTDTEFFIREQNIDSFGTITVDGVATAPTTTDLTLGKFTFSPALADDKVVLATWTKTDATHANLVKKNRFATKFGVGNDTSIFIWGHPDFKNARRWCGTLNAGYFPLTNLTNVGTNDSAITDIKTNNANYQIIFKEGETHFSYAEYIAATGTWDYPVKNLRSDVGNITFNGVQIVNNSPLSIQGKSWWLWSSTTVKDERNADVISERLRSSLSAIDLTTAVTFDYQSEKEYWCNVDDMVYIWNYGNNTMYTFDNIGGTCFLDIDGVVYYGSQGTIERMEGTDDNGEIITAQIDTGFNAYGAMHMIKSSDSIYLGLLPDSRTSLKIYFRTNKKTEWKLVKKVAEYALIDFDNIDFDDFSFLTNRNPQTFAMPFTSGDYTYIQYRFENAELDETCIILDFLVNAEVQGEI
jgi:hypothetical protein